MYCGDLHMQEHTLDIINKLGLHARAATKLANLAQRYASSVVVAYAGKEVDCKSIMSLMLLAAANGCRITIKTQGEDEQEALEAVTTLITNRFGEDE